MQPSEIMEVLLDWNFWKKDIDTGIERAEVVERLARLARIGEITVVSGARRSGKSTSILQFCRFLFGRGVRKEDVLIVNFEDPRLKDLGIGLLNRIYETYLTEMNPGKEQYVVLDEVQVVDGWERFARLLHENKKAHVFLTGSSSKLLGSEYATVLAGRHVDMEVYPLGFREFLAFRGVILKDGADVMSRRHEIKRLMSEYLKWGGFPKPTLLGKEDDKKELLNSYFRDIMIKDVAMRHRIKDIVKLEELARYYLSNVASMQSFNKIKNVLGISIDTVERFSRYFSEAYLVFFVKRFSYSEKEQILNPRKVYCIDTGMRNAASFVFMENTGRLMENAVFIELRRRGKEVFYWKGDAEIDLVVKEGKDVSRLIQVCYDIENDSARKREVAALSEAMEKFNLRNGLVITWDFEGEDRIKEGKIAYKPLWKWLLE